MKSPHHTTSTWLLVLLAWPFFMLSLAHAQIDINNTALETRVAAGDLLPIAVTLSNFGGGERVDVLVTYSIVTSNGETLYSTHETVAVETTASFVKTMQIPFATAAGTYKAQTSVVYEGQLVPATASFSFIVEQKVFGFFQKDLFLYGGVTILISIGIVVVGSFVMRRRKTRFTPFDYSAIPHDVRTFYEIISDTIMQMRGRAGDEAIAIASRIDDLTIDGDTGRVLAVTGSPTKIIAELVAEYEKLLGKKVSFSFRKEKKE